jgi:hypothetical protein
MKYLPQLILLFFFTSCGVYNKSLTEGALKNGDSLNEYLNNDSLRLGDRVKVHYKSIYLPIKGSRKMVAGKLYSVDSSNAIVAHRKLTTITAGGVSVVRGKQIPHELILKTEYDLNKSRTVKKTVWRVISVPVFSIGLIIIATNSG